MTYEELKYKSDLAKLNAMKADTDWAFWYWKTVSEKLLEKALQCEV